MGITITNSGQGSVVRFRNLGRGGVMTSTKIPLLLNLYSGAAAAYSLRKINGSYSGPAIRVRRSSDSTEQDIGFLNGELDKIALTAFIGNQNLVQRSEEFDNAYWTKAGLQSLVVNATTAPDGTLTADKLVEDSANSAHAAYFAGPGAIGTTIIVNQVYTASVYAKYESRRYLFLSFFTQDARNVIVADLISGTITSSALINSPKSTSSKIENVGNGWYRVSLSLSSTTTNMGFIIGMSNSATPTFNPSSGDISYAGDGVSGIYIWGAQINKGGLQPYTKTTSAAVANYGYVTKWYDQSGNARDLSQTTTANQPEISGYGGANPFSAKPAITLNGTTMCLERVDTGLPLLSATYTTITYRNSIATSNILGYGVASNGSVVYLYYDPSSMNVSQYGNGVVQAISTYTYNYQFVDKPATTGVWSQWVNNSLFSSTNMQTNTTYLNTAGSFRIGQGNSGLPGSYLNGDVQEIIMWPTTLTSNRSEINTNINSYYSIY